MNTHNDEDRNHLRYAEYVLGVLDADARAAVAREVIDNSEAATAVARWQRHLAPLTLATPDIAPPEHVWSNIGRALRFNSHADKEARGSFLDNLRLWQWLSIGASAIALACVVMMLRTVTTPTHQIAPQALMVSSIKQTSGTTAWIATMDLSRKEMIVVPAVPVAHAKDRSTQLWLIPSGGKPISLGIFKSDDTNVIALNASLLTQLGPTAVLAVSIEPLGGSPSGQPTGPVVAQGKIDAAPKPAAGNKLAALVEFPGKVTFSDPERKTT